MARITDALIKERTGEFDTEVVQWLVLERMGLTRIEAVGELCHNLVELSLSGNAIAKIEGLDTLVKLRKLNLSLNRIATLGEFRRVRLLVRAAAAARAVRG